MSFATVSFLQTFLFWHLLRQSARNKKDFLLNVSLFAATVLSFYYPKSDSKKAAKKQLHSLWQSCHRDPYSVSVFLP